MIFYWSTIISVAISVPFSNDSKNVLIFRIARDHWKWNHLINPTRCYSSSIATMVISCTISDINQILFANRDYFIPPSGLLHNYSPRGKRFEIFFRCFITTELDTQLNSWWKSSAKSPLYIHSSCALQMEFPSPWDLYNAISVQRKFDLNSVAFTL